MVVLVVYVVCSGGYGNGMAACRGAVLTSGGGTVVHMRTR